MRKGPAPWKTLLVIIGVLLLLGVVFGTIKTFVGQDLRGNLVVEDGTVEVFFCQTDDCEHVMLNELGKAEEIQCAFYDLDLETVEQLLVQKQADLLVYEENYAGVGQPISSKGYMHHKFCVLDQHTVLTGSTNPTENGVRKNDNNLLVIESRTIAYRYLAEFEQLGKTKRRIAPRYIQLPDALVQVLFCPQERCEDAVVAAINDAEHSVQFMTFSFTSDPIGEAVLAAADRGVLVEGVMEKRQNSQYSEYALLSQWTVWDSNPATMHHKVFIIDNTTVITGSMNPTWSGGHRNDENLLIIQDEHLAREFLEEFARVALPQS